MLVVSIINRFLLEVGDIVSEGRFFLREHFAVEWTVTSLHLLLSQTLHVLLLQRCNMVLQSNFLYSASGFVQFWFLKILRIRPDKVKPAPRVRIAAISADTVSFGFTADEFVSRLRACLRLARAVM